jgi:hypothetical protein
MGRLARNTRSVENASSAWSPASASGYATAAAKPRSRVNAAGRGRPKKGTSWWDYLKTGAKIGLGATLATGALIAGLEAGNPAFYDQNLGPAGANGGGVFSRYSLKSSVKPFVDAVGPFVEPIYTFDWCKGVDINEAIKFEPPSRCSMAALVHAKYLDAHFANEARLKSEKDYEDAEPARKLADEAARAFEDDIEARKSIKGESRRAYEAQLVIGRHLTHTTVSTHGVLSSGQPGDGDVDRSRVETGLVLFAVAASNENVATYEAERELKDAISAIRNDAYETASKETKAKRVRIVEGAERKVRELVREGHVDKNVARRALIALRETLTLANDTPWYKH